MKRFLKPALAGAALGGVELVAAAILAGGAVPAFENWSCGLGVGTLLVGLLVLFGGRRAQAGMNISPTNAGAQSAFGAQIAFDEARALGKSRPAPAGYLVWTAVFFVGALVTLAGFGVSLLL